METPQYEKTSEEQRAYATLMDLGMKLGFVLLLITFTVYLLGLVPAHVPVEQLPYYWAMPAKEYLHAANVPHGWGWLKLAGQGDFMNFIGIAFLAGVTIPCYMRILPILLKNKDTVYSIIAVLEIVVLVLAASGILVSGH